MPPSPGQVYHYPDYKFPDGDQRDKYVVLMGGTRADDWILARTTSRQNGRPTQPRCYHGHPYPGFFIETAGGLMRLPSWLVLNRLDDYDAQEFSARIASHKVTLAGSLPDDIFCEALRCAVQAQDTTREQERAMHDLLAKLQCPF